jgi:hypothetical protein
MNKKLILLISAFLFFMFSCSNEDKRTSLIFEKLESMTGREMLRDLLIQNDNDIEQLSRIFECSPSSLDRILKGNSLPTPEAISQFKNILTETTIIKNKNFNELDPLKKSWYEKIPLLPDNHYAKIGILIFLCLLFIGIVGNNEDGKQSGCGSGCGVIILLLVIVFLLWAGISFFQTPIAYGDNFKYTLDPIWETL